MGTAARHMWTPVLAAAGLLALTSITNINAQDPNPKIGCIVEHCTPEVAYCELKKDCRDAMNCFRKCASVKDNKTPGCAYLCEMTDGKNSPRYQPVLDCMYNNKCMGHYPKDGTCLARDEDAVQNITSLAMLKGDWWVLKGINCGQ